MPSLLAWLTSRGERRRQRKRRQWEAAGRPETPPSSVKHEIMLEYARRFRLTTFVETGTHRGGTVEAMNHAFRRVYTIELGMELWAKARRRFARNGHVTVLQGDSAQVLPTVLARLTEPALFWLDAHYSGPRTARGSRDTPITEELSAILAHPVAGHVVLIDDAREFGALADYPTLAELEAFVHARATGLAYEVRDDVIRIHPAGA
jgi:hypothetical protein